MSQITLHSKVQFNILNACFIALFLLLFIVGILSQPVLLIISILLSIFLFTGIYFFFQRQLNRSVRQETLALKNSEWFEKTLISIGDGVIATDEQLLISFMNPVAEMLTGWTEAEAKGKPVEQVFKLINAYTRQKVDNPLVKAITEKQIVTLAANTLLVKKDQSEIDIDDSGAPVFDANGNVTGAILIFRDITETKHAEQELNLFFGLSVDMAGVISPEGYFKRISPSVEKILGYNETEFVNRPIVDYLHPDDVESTLADIQKLAAGIPTFNSINRYRCKNGDYKWMEWNVSSNGKLFYAIGRDINERKQAEDELQTLHLELQVKNNEIVDSIHYAKRIQNAFLPVESGLQELFSDSFVLNKPKDIVSGDFYWMNKTDRKLMLAVADCTGHGVPGALLSIIGSQKLNKAAAISTDTSEMLSYLNTEIKTSLRQTESYDSTRDGMDIALCSVEYDDPSDPNTTVKLQYAGANRPIWIMRKGHTVLEEIKATKMAIGGFTENDQHFETHELQLQRGDMFYLFSDGYCDQFSGINGKKMMIKRFKEHLLTIHKKSMQDQSQFLENFVEGWKGAAEQVDDMLIIGVRL